MISNIHTSINEMTKTKLPFQCRTSPLRLQELRFPLLSLVFSPKRVSITRIWNRVINFETGYPVLATNH